MTTAVEMAYALQADTSTGEGMVHPHVYPLHQQLVGMVLSTGLSPVANAQILALGITAAACGMTFAVDQNEGLAEAMHDIEGLHVVSRHLRAAADLFDKMLEEAGAGAN